MEQMHRTAMAFGLLMIGVVACAGGERELSDSATAVASASASGASASTGSASAGASGAAAGTTSGSAAGTTSGTASGTATPAATGSSSGTTSGVAAGGASGAAAPATPSVPQGISAATGVFTAAQAARGQEVYTNACARCHVTTQHSGATFASTWNNRRVFDLYDILYNTMPLDDPGSLSDQEYVDVVAYILQLNGHRAGKAPLTADPAALKALRIDIRTSAGP